VDEGLVELEGGEEVAFFGEILHQAAQVNLILEVRINPLLEFLAGGERLLFLQVLVFFFAAAEIR